MSTAFCTTRSKPSPFATTVLLAASAMAASRTASAQTADPASHLLALAQSTSLESDAYKPWRLRVSFRVNKIQGEPLDAGTVDVLWDGKHESVDVQSQVFHGALPEPDAAFAAGTSREAYLIRQLLDQTVRPFAGFSTTGLIDVTQEKRRFGKVELNCIIVSRARSGDPSDSLCTEVDRPDVLRVHLGQGFSMARNRMATFQGTFLALDNTILYSGKSAIEGHTDKLETTTVPTQDAETDLKPAPSVAGVVFAGRKLGGDVPSYPRISRERHSSGSVVLSAIIDRTGHIQDLAVIGSPDDALSQSALDAVKTWTYLPYQLNGQACEVATTITINYNLSSR